MCIRDSFTPCAKENHMEATNAARPINKPNTEPPADPIPAPKIKVQMCIRDSHSVGREDYCTNHEEIKASLF